jgi:homoserine kinase
MEGHADNVAAAIAGGFTVAYRTERGWRSVSLEPSRAIRAVLLIPDTARVSTEEARRVLPRDVPREDAVFNAARAALMTVALTTRPDLLVDAVADRLHQRQRMSLVPEVAEAFDRLTAAGVPVCLAGSGPSLLAFETEGSPPVGDPPEGWRVERLAFSPGGVSVAVV